MIRVLLVDDEEPARERLRRLLSSLEDVRIVGEAGDGNQALQQILSLRPDVVLLDIQMPGLTGLQIASQLSPPRPRIVFCTAFDQFALEAFEQNAVDYLLKPVSRDKLARALERVRNSLPEELRQDLQAAGETQLRLLPQQLPRLRTLDYTGFSSPARMVGGDYYDFLPIEDGRLGIAVADVSGKGIAAALLMASLQGMIQSHAGQWATRPSDLMSRINRQMSTSTDSGRFATFFYGLYDDRLSCLTYVNAGHPAPLIYRPSSATLTPAQIIRLDKGGMVIGVFSETPFVEEQIQLRPDDMLVVYSDGVTEAMNSREEEFGEQRLIENLMANADAPIEVVRDRLLSAVRSFVREGPLHDDLTLVVARVRKKDDSDSGHR